MIRDWRWTGDAELENVLRPALELHLQWAQECFDPDGDGLYESYINTLPTDSVWYNGGGSVEESAYAYYGHLAARDMARRAGDTRGGGAPPGAGRADQAALDASVVAEGPRTFRPVRRAGRPSAGTRRCLGLQPVLADRRGPDYAGAGIAGVVLHASGRWNGSACRSAACSVSLRTGCPRNGRCATCSAATTGTWPWPASRPDWAMRGGNYCKAPCWRAPTRACRARRVQPDRRRHRLRRQQPHVCPGRG